MWKEQLNVALQIIAERFDEAEGGWLVGGSCGLYLQGVPIGGVPRDLDLYCDRDAAPLLHERLSPYSTDQQVEDQSGLYRSILSHYAVSDVRVELVGAFEVITKSAHYRVDVERLAARASIMKIGSHSIRLMPLEHELVFNVLRDRPDRYEPIAERLRQTGGSKPWLEEIISSSRMESSIANLLLHLVSPEGREPRMGVLS